MNTLTTNHYKYTGKPNIFSKDAEGLSSLVERKLSGGTNLV